VALVIRAGKLSKRITIQTPTETADSYGEPDLSWSSYHECWASIEPVSGRELVASQQTQAMVSHLVRIRYKAGVTPRMRVKYMKDGTARYFGIGSVVNVDERNEEMQLACSEVL